MVLGQPVYLDAKAEGDNSILVKRWRSEVVVGPGAARPARHGKGYTCLNSNSQSDYSGSHRPQRLLLCAACEGDVAHFPFDLYVGRRWVMNPFKGVSGVPTTRYYRLYYRTMGLPTGRESYGNGASVVVCGRESRLHGEGKQVVSTYQAGRYA